MRIEMYVRDRQLFEIFENLFNLFHKYLVFVECTQTHVVLSKRETPREEVGGLNQSICTKRNEKKEKRTSTDLHPVRLTPLVPSSRATPQQIMMKPGDWRDSMRYVMRRIISCVSAAGFASGSTFSSVVL